MGAVRIVGKHERQKSCFAGSGQVARAGPFFLRNLHVTAKLKDPTMQNLDTALAASGRFLIAALFLLSGVAKIAAPAMIEGYIAAAGVPAPLLGYLIAIIVEVGGGVLLIVGFQTRIVALILAVFTLAAALAFQTNSLIR